MGAEKIKSTCGNAVVFPEPIVGWKGGRQNWQFFSQHGTKRFRMPVVDDAASV